MKRLLLAFTVLLVLVAAVIVTGVALPERHEVSRSATFARAPGEVWRAISDYRGQAQWREDLREVEVLPPGEDGLTLVREVGSDGEAISYVTLESDPPRRLVRRIADESLPFGGTWTFEVEAAGAGSRLTITERGEVYNPVFRVVSRFVIGHAASIERYLGQLQRHFVE